jgi:hypothetical protein
MCSSEYLEKLHNHDHTNPNHTSTQTVQIEHLTITFSQVGYHTGPSPARNARPSPGAASAQRLHDASSAGPSRKHHFKRPSPRQDVVVQYTRKPNSPNHISTIPRSITPKHPRCRQSRSTSFKLRAASAPPGSSRNWGSTTSCAGRVQGGVGESAGQVPDAARWGARGA